MHLVSYRIMIIVMSIHPFSYALIISHLPQGERQGKSWTGHLSLTFLPERQTTVYTCGQFSHQLKKKKKYFGRSQDAQRESTGRHRDNM